MVQVKQKTFNDNLTAAQTRRARLLAAAPPLPQFRLSGDFDDALPRLDSRIRPIYTKYLSTFAGFSCALDLNWTWASAMGFLEVCSGGNFENLNYNSC